MFILNTFHFTLLRVISVPVQVGLGVVNSIVNGAESSSEESEPEEAEPRELTEQEKMEAEGWTYVKRGPRNVNI